MACVRTFIEINKSLEWFVCETKRMYLSPFGKNMFLTITFEVKHLG